MDTNKMHVTPSKTTLAQSFSSLSMSGCGNGIIDTACSNEHTNVGYNCNRDTFSKNTSSKVFNNPRGTNNSNATYGSAGSNTSGYCSSSNSSTSGNYYKVLPVSMGNVQQQQQQQQENLQQQNQHMQHQQYNRKKPTQEYQSRLYNNTDYKCRDDFYSLGNGSSSGRISLTASSPSLQLHNIPQHYNNNNNNHHNHHHHHHHYQHNGSSESQQQQLQQQIAQQNNHHTHYHSQHHQQHQNLQHYNHQQQQQQQQQHETTNQQHGQHYLHNHQSHPQLHQQLTLVNNTETNNYGELAYNVPHQHICTPSNINTDEEGNICSMVNQSKRMVASTQTPLTENSNAVDSLTSPGITINGSHAMYSLHRAITTAQVQTGTINAFASSSSISSVMSSVRNDTDCLQVPGSIGGTESISAGFINCNINSNNNNNNNNNNELPGQNSTTIPTGFRGLNGSNSNCLSQTQQHTTPRLVNNNNNNNFGNFTGSSTNTSYVNGAKTMYSPQPRLLENVIPTCVYLMSRVAVHMEIEGTAQCPTQVMLAAALGCEELGIANKLLAQSIFALWMVSPLLELQLKAHHRPYLVRLAWSKLLEKFSNGTPIDKSIDEPMITLRRNVFFSKRDEEKIKDHRILELLYEEAKHNVLTGRYIMEPVHALMLGGIQARIELGPYNSHTHTISYFRENQTRFLPHHVAKSSSWSWLPVSRGNSAEVKLLDQFKRVPQTTTTRKLMRKYLEFCWALPFYGASFFHGQVEQPVRGLMSLINQKDLDVEVAVNERGIYIIDIYENTLLLGLRYEDFSWDYAKPSSNDPECLTCIFLQFNAIENGIQITKLMQVFSKQAAMIDALISHFADQMRKRRQDAQNGSDLVYDEPNPIQNNGQGVLSNKLSCLTLATFDEEGRCIGQMGTLSISF